MTMNNMKNVTIKVPKCYKWMAIQPTGEIEFFKTKPEIFAHPNYDYIFRWSIDRFPVFGFDQPNTLYFGMDGEAPKDFRKTLKKI
jgi:hypothetical protein